MEKVTLKFTSVQLLWAFKKEIKAGSVDINLATCTLVCHCSETDVTLALKKYAAQVVSSQAGQ